MSSAFLLSRLVVFLFFQSAWCVVYDRSVFGIRSIAWCCLSWIFLFEKLYVRPVDKLSRLTLYCSVLRAHNMVFPPNGFGRENPIQT